MTTQMRHAVLALVAAIAAISMCVSPTAATVVVSGDGANYVQNLVGGVEIAATFDDTLETFSASSTTIALVQFSHYISDTRRAELFAHFNASNCYYTEKVEPDGKFDGATVDMVDPCALDLVKLRRLEGVIGASWNEEMYYQYSWDTTQTVNVPVGLDRIDQIPATPDATYGYNHTGTNVEAWIVDTGARVTHSNYGGRMSLDFDAYPSEPLPDCHGHGSHVSGIVGSNTYGVAKNVNLHAARVLSCAGTGTSADVISAISAVRSYKTTTSNPVVMNLSLGSRNRGQLELLDNALQNAIAEGIFVSVAAGNEGDDSCYYNKNALSKITPIAVAGATEVVGGVDVRAQFGSGTASHYGRCINIWAPGKAIKSLHINGDYNYRTTSGTSQAAPHVAGVAALYYENHPSATPLEVMNAIQEASIDVVTDVGYGGIDSLLQSAIQTASNPTEPLPAPCDENAECSKFSVAVSGTVDDFYPSANGFPVYGRAYMHGWLHGPNDGTDAALDLDLALQKCTGDPCTWSLVDVSSSLTSSEKLVEVQGSGRYRWHVFSNCGGSCPSSSSYDFYSQQGYMRSNESAVDRADHCTDTNTWTSSAFALDEWNGMQCWSIMPQPGRNYTITSHTSGAPGSCPGDTHMSVFSCGTAPCSDDNPGSLVGEDDDSGPGTCSQIVLDAGLDETGTDHYDVCVMVKYASGSAIAVTPIYDLEVTWQTAGEAALCDTSASEESNCTQLCASIEGDPHFVGFRGQRFDFHGSVGGIYNLLSEPYMLLNARFVEGDVARSGTYVGELGFRFGPTTHINVRCNGRALQVLLDDAELPADEYVFLDENSHVYYDTSSRRDRLQLSVADTYEFEITRSKSRVSSCFLNIAASYAMNSELISEESADGETATAEGVLGSTISVPEVVDLDAIANGADASKYSDGVSVVSATDGQHYHVASEDIFASTFDKNTFTGISPQYVDRTAESTHGRKLMALGSYEDEIGGRKLMQSGCSC